MRKKLRKKKNDCKCTSLILQLRITLFFFERDKNVCRMDVMALYGLLWSW